jgi:ectoine hydroxylase-related dioxygenase (phytanoyl-CoA dioxygenase family)
MSTAILERPLQSNGYTLAMTPDRIGRLEATDPQRPVAELREQFRAQGYLWLKGLLPRAEVLEFRRRFFAACEASGLLAPGSDPVDAIYSGNEDKALMRKTMIEAVRWAAYEAFCLSPQIWRFYESFFGNPVYLHKRKLIRSTRPFEENCTGAHYDLTYLRGGTDTVCTSWIPIGDIPVQMGGLIYLEGADAAGRRLEADFSAMNKHLPRAERISAYNKNMGSIGWLTKDLPALANRLDSRWLIADYEAGDMVVHSAYMIHAATMNENPNGRMRLSTDIRYQSIREEIDVRWQNHWSYDDML